MPKITFLPSGKSVEAKVGDSLLDIALANDISIQHACGGFCACTTCHCEVLEGAGNLLAPDDDESERLEVMEERTEKSRLGCQSKVQGDVTVRVVNVD
jgi:2Fe-2S ferredoxin